MEGLLVIVGLLIGAAAGAVVTWLICERRARSGSGELRTATALAEQRCTDLAAQLESARRETTDIRSQHSESERSAATLEAQLQSAQQNLNEQKQMLDDAHTKLREAFASVSSEALAKNNEAFLHLAKERFAHLSTQATGSLDERKAQIEGLLKPMQELLNQYQTRLSEVEKSRVESYSMLREQLGVLAETQRTLNTQTHQLVSALRRPTSRGQWGEITLKRLVELAGMSNRCDFFEQQTMTDAEDNRLRPDMIVRLPAGREIVIDCKACLDAFLDAAAAPDDDHRKAHLIRHSQHVRSRARELSAKSYWSQFKRSPEYVVMFLPGEAFLYAAAENDPMLIEDCLKNRVIVATPTTLISLLKAIEFGWRQEDMSENAEKIRKLGVELYDRIFTMGNYIAKLGNAIDSTVGAYNQAVGSIESRVMVTAKKMAELGAKSDKELPDLEPVDVKPRELTTLAAQSISTGS